MVPLRSYLTIVLFLRNYCTLWYCFIFIYIFSNWY